MKDDDLQETNQAKERERSLDETLSESVKFGILVIALLAALLLATVFVPKIAQEMVPAVLGLDRSPATARLSKPLPEFESAESVEPEDVVPESQELIYHTVEEGETLFRIAVAYGVTVEEIATANRLVNPGELEVGSVLVVVRPG